MATSSSHRAGSRSAAHISSAVSSIRRIVRVLRLAAQQTQAVAGISAAQLFVLQQLGDGEGRSMKDLAERTLTDRTSVSAVVARLQAEGLVDRMPAPEDRRRAVVRITAAGHRLLRRAPDAPTTALLGALGKLTPRELAALARSLDHLTVALGASNEPPGMLFSDEPLPPRGPVRGSGRRRR